MNLLDEINQLGSRILVIVAMALAFTSCHHAIEQPAATIRVADPNIEKQLLTGFYDAGTSDWRWTAKQFAVALGPPKGAQQNGAELWVSLFIPDDEIRQLGPMKLSASAPGYEFDQVEFSNGGSHRYSTRVPAGALCTNLLPVTFSFDRALPPSASDSRQLGAVVTSIGLR